MTLPAGVTVVSKGDVADCMYFIQEGELEVFVEEAGVSKLVATLGSNDERSGDAGAMFFGEKALVEETTRNA